MTLQDLEDPELVITRDSVLPSREIRFRLIQRTAEHSAPTLIEINHIRIQVPFPRSQVRHFQLPIPVSVDSPAIPARRLCAPVSDLRERPLLFNSSAVRCSTLFFHYLAQRFFGLYSREKQCL